MRFQIERFRRAIWTYKQPLTRNPSLSTATVSDLFLWRNDETWKAVFELTDLYGLFSDTEQDRRRSVVIRFFDNNGNSLVETEIPLKQNKRQTISLERFLTDVDRSYGTFCVFHSHTPPELVELGAFIAERGYVSYQYKDAPLRSYVHGNFDAAALSEKGRVELLGGTSFFPREYRLQCDLTGPSRYEVFFVNPCSSEQRLSCVVFAPHKKALLQEEILSVKSGGCGAMRILVEDSTHARLVVRSKFVMARPLVFAFQGDHLNVFHG